MLVALVTNIRYDGKLRHGPNRKVLDTSDRKYPFLHCFKIVRLLISDKVNQPKKDCEGR